MKKLFFFTLIVLVAIGVFFIKNTEPAKKIRVAYQPQGPMESFLIFVAKQEKLFDKYNLPVDFIQVTANSEVSFANIFANPSKVDYTPFVMEGTVVSQREAPVKVIMAFSESTPYYLMSRPGLQLKDLKTISIDFPSTIQNYLILKFIDEQKLSAKIIYSMRNTINSENDVINQKAMLMTGKIEAIVTSVPVVFAFQELVSGRPVILETFSGEEITGITTTDEKIKNNPKEVKKVIKVMQSAIDFIQSNPEKTKELLLSFYKYKKNEANDKIIEKIYQVIKETFTSKGLPAGNNIKRSIQLFKAGEFKSAQDVEKQVITPEDLAKTFDFQFLK